MTGFVYFISYPDSRWVKVGFARDVSARMATLQCSTPERLTLEAVVPSGPSGERKLHKAIYGPRRGEWFKLAFVRDLIEAAKGGASIDEITARAKEQGETIAANIGHAKYGQLIRGWVRTALNESAPTYLRQACRENLEDYGETDRLTAIVHEADGLKVAA